MRELSRNQDILSPKLYNTSGQNNRVIGNFMKRLCTCLVSMAISRSNKLWNKTEVKNKVNFNFIFISIEKKLFWKYPTYIGENPGTNQNFIAYLL